MNEIDFLKFFLAICVSFFSGAIPFGYLIGRAKGVDIRNQGSGNTGATNTARVLGKKAGLLTLCCDALKGALPVFLLPLVFPEIAPLSPLLTLAALIGHCYSPFLKFKGGKGVATGIGAFSVAAPVESLLVVIVFFLVFFKWRYVSLSSIVAASLLPVFILLVSFSGAGDRNLLWAVGLISACLVTLRHKENIERLRAGTEKRFGRT